jgi:hypothetical protein
MKIAKSWRISYRGWQESMAESKEHWLEQGTKIDQLVLQMKTISTQFQQFIAS